MRVGAAQMRALEAMAFSFDGTAGVPWASASGLIIRGLATSVGPLGRQRNPVCRITDAGRELVTALRKAA